MTNENALPQLRRLSHPFMILLSIAFTLLVLFQIFVIAMLLFFRGGDTWHGAVSFAASGINLSVFGSSTHSPDVAIESLSFGQRAALALLAAVCGTCGGFVIFHLRQLFALYCRGVVFAEENIRHIMKTVFDFFRCFSIFFCYLPYPKGLELLYNINKGHAPPYNNFNN